MKRQQYGQSVVGKTLGFTLMEILVAMALTSLLVLVMALAFRSGLDAWRRLGEDPNRQEILTSLSAALERDLDFVATLRPFSSGVGGRSLPLCGTSKALAFWTRYAPEGSPLQGVHLVAYIYDAANKEVLVYRLKPPFDIDLAAETRAILQGLEPALAPVGRVPHVDLFELEYEVPSENQTEDQGAVWAGDWACEGRDDLPRRVRLHLGVSHGTRTLARTSTFVIGVIGLMPQGS